MKLINLNPIKQLYLGRLFIIAIYIPRAVRGIITGRGRRLKARGRLKPKGCHAS